MELIRGFLLRLYSVDTIIEQYLAKKQTPFPDFSIINSAASVEAGLFRLGYTGS